MKGRIFSSCSETTIEIIYLLLLEKEYEAIHAYIYTGKSGKGFSERKFLGSKKVDPKLQFKCQFLPTLDKCF